MRSTPFLLALGAFATCVAAPSLRAADATCTGHYVNVGSRSISVSNNPTDSDHVMIGECNSDGICTRRDKDGDELKTQTAYTPGEYLATWKNISGTGKYANRKRSGWFKQTRAEGDVAVGDWGGDCR